MFDSIHSEDFQKSRSFVNHHRVVPREFRRTIWAIRERTGDGREDEHFGGRIFLRVSGGAESEDVVRML